MSSAALVSAARPLRTKRSVWHGAILALRPLHALLAAPSWVFLAALTAMLFRPPDLKLYEIDRIGFAALLVVVSLRALLLRQSMRAPAMVLAPSGILMVLAVARAVGERYEPEQWSVLAAKWVVPCGLFYCARMVFRSEAELKRLEMFLLIVLGYLALIAILFLVGEKSLIFPQFIVDQGLGIHAERARGPFLQAVANGVTLNLLGLIAFDSYRRRRLQGMAAALLLAALPLAVLATKTRGVWASFGMSLAALLWLSPSTRVRRICVAMILSAALAVVCAVTFGDPERSFQERLEERSPLKFRLSVYEAGLEMFLAKPWLGWGTAQMQPELARRISDFHQDEFYFHNTLLEVAVDYGVVGLGLYLWLVFDLWRAGRVKRAKSLVRAGTFGDLEFRRLWPVLLGVYLLNACFVVMNYQFVNGLLFSVAGILSAQNEEPEYASC